MNLPLTHTSPTPTPRTPSTPPRVWTVERRRPVTDCPTSRTPGPSPAASRSKRSGDLAMDLATGGFDAVAWEVALFVCDAAMAGEDPVLLAIVADPDLPDVVRQRAFGRIPARREPAATQANAR